MPNTLSFFFEQLAKYSDFDEVDREAVLSIRSTTKIAPAGSCFAREGDVSNTCAVLVEGLAFRQKLTDTGARQIMGIIIPGDALNLPNVFLGSSDHEVRALTEVKVAFVTRSAILELAKNRPAVAHSFFIWSLIDASVSREWVLNIGQRDARTRFAHFLCEHAERMHARGLGTRDTIDLPMTQEQLADATGITAVHINRMLKSLEADNLIVRDRRFIKIPSVEALNEVATFRPRYLHLSLEGIFKA